MVDWAKNESVGPSGEVDLTAVERKKLTLAVKAMTGFDITIRNTDL